MQTKHQPVLLDQVLRLLDPQPGQTYFDGTAGYGGHAEAVTRKTGRADQAILIDRDLEAVKQLKEKFPKAQVRHQEYRAAAAELAAAGVQVDMVLLDIGVSSAQLDQADRGFSFRQRGPLDMRMDRSQSLTAEEVVNSYPYVQLRDIIRRYGEEPRAGRVASAIVAARPLRDTEQLAEAIRGSAARTRDIDPATRTFQAIRIEVNNELANLEQALPELVRILKTGGRLAVISFHSLEDRIVKQFFDRESKDCICPPKQPICICGHQAAIAKLTKRPVTARQSEIDNNPRARSAKLRAAVKINKNQKEGT